MTAVSVNAADVVDRDTPETLARTRTVHDLQRVCAALTGFGVRVEELHVRADGSVSVIAAGVEFAGVLSPESGVRPLGGPGVIGSGEELRQALWELPRAPFDRCVPVDVRGEAPFTPAESAALRGRLYAVLSALGALAVAAGFGLGVGALIWAWALLVVTVGVGAAHPRGAWAWWRARADEAALRAAVGTLFEPILVTAWSRGQVE